MAIAWGTPVKIIDAVTVNADSESSLSTEVDLDSCIGVVGFSVQTTFNASATAGIVLNIYPSYDGTNYADTPVEVSLISETDLGNPTEKYVYFPVSCRKMKATVQNLDTSYSVTATSVWAHKQTFTE